MFCYCACLVFTLPSVACHATGVAFGDVLPVSAPLHVLGAKYRTTDMFFVPSSSPSSCGRGMLLRSVNSHSCRVTPLCAFFSSMPAICTGTFWGTVVRVSLDLFSLHSFATTFRNTQHQGGKTRLIHGLMYTLVWYTDSPPPFFFYVSYVLASALSSFGSPVHLICLIC